MAISSRVWERVMEIAAQRLDTVETQCITVLTCWDGEQIHRGILVGTNFANLLLKSS